MKVFLKALVMSALCICGEAARAEVTTDDELYALGPIDHSQYELVLPERPHVQHHWGGERNEPWIDPERVTRLVFGWSRHVGSKHRPNSSTPWYTQFQEHNPGMGASVSFGSCFSGRFECHGSAIYIDQNSLRGKAVTVGGGMSRELLQISRAKLSVGVEGFILLYRAGYSNKKLIGPLALPVASLDIKIDKNSFIGLGVQVLPVRAGDARRIELYNWRLHTDF
jgi:hypothetical protein